ncbi:hypothetical protein [Streptomyces iranensis]|uniref:hypothetical protein n=1 Tax=Streptomyces iranensis TaxID=576784 RepID=UPI0039B745AB
MAEDPGAFTEGPDAFAEDPDAFTEDPDAFAEDPDAFTIEPSPSGRLLCGGCAPHDVCRLGVEIAEAWDDAVRFEVVCPPFWHGGPGVAHGG